MNRKIRSKTYWPTSNSSVSTLLLLTVHVKCSVRIKQWKERKRRHIVLFFNNFLLIARSLNRRKFVNCQRKGWAKWPPLSNAELFGSADAAILCITPSNTMFKTDFGDLLKLKNISKTIEQTQFSARFRVRVQDFFLPSSQLRKKDRTDETWNWRLCQH